MNDEKTFSPEELAQFLRGDHPTQNPWYQQRLKQLKTSRTQLEDWEYEEMCQLERMLNNA